MAYVPGNIAFFFFSPFSKTIGFRVRCWNELRFNVSFTATQIRFLKLNIHIEGQQTREKYLNYAEETIIVVALKRVISVLRTKLQNRSLVAK